MSTGNPVEHFCKGNAVVTGCELRAVVLGMDSGARKVCAFAGGWAGMRVDGSQGGIKPLCEVLQGVGCERVECFSMPYIIPITESALAFQQGGRGSAASFARCLFNPFGRRKFVRIAPGDEGLKNKKRGAARYV